MQARVPDLEDAWADDVHLVDPLSSAVIASAISSRRVFAVLTGRAVYSSPAGGDLTGLTRQGIVRELDIGPLDEVDVDVLLYRALGAPIDDDSLAALAAASGRRPGTGPIGR